MCRPHSFSLVHLYRHSSNIDAFEIGDPRLVLGIGPQNMVERIDPSGALTHLEVEIESDTVGGDGIRGEDQRFGELPTVPEDGEAARGYSDTDHIQNMQFALLLEVVGRDPAARAHAAAAHAVPARGLFRGLAVVVPGAEFGEAGVELERAADTGDVVVLDGRSDDQRLHRQVGDAEQFIGDQFRHLVFQGRRHLLAQAGVIRCVPMVILLTPRRASAL